MTLARLTKTLPEATRIPLKFYNLATQMKFCIMKKYILLLAAIMRAACTPGDITPDEPKIPESDGYDDGYFTPEIDTDEGGYDGDTATDGDQDIIEDDEDKFWEQTEFSSNIKIVYNGTSAEVECNNPDIAVHQSGADVAIELGDVADAEITLEGATEDGQLKVYGNASVKVTLNGVSLKSAKSAAINFQNKSTLFLHLSPDTQNVLCDASKQTAEAYYPDGVASGDEKRNGCIYAMGDIVLSGTGVLSMDGKKKHGISAKGSALVRPGVTLTINDVADNCIKADGITINGGYIWAKTSAEAGKCLSSDADVEIHGGELKLYTSGGSIYDSDKADTSSPAGIKADGNMTITAGNILCVSSGDGGKGINVDGTLTIDGGVIDIATSGGKYVYNAAKDLDSSPKGVKADGEIFINGGSLNIQVTGRSEGSEGLESKKKITINDGELFVYSYDDAINVGGNSPVGIEINGGKIFAFADNNDGIDSNGKMWINGGLVIASGSAAPEEGLDCDRSQDFIVTGGTLIGTGGASVSTSTTSTQRSVIYNGISAATGMMVVITDSSDSPILQYEVPRSMSKLSLFFSSADIKSGETYKVHTGGSIEGASDDWNGWYNGGTYTGGSELGSFTSSSVTTTVGQSSGPGGGGGGRPGNGDGGWGPGWWG